jgi:hypothetical protein
MKQLFIRGFGKLIASAAGRRLLFAHAMRHPHKHLPNLDGSLYMGRWHVIDEDTIAGKVLEFFTGYASARLHLIMREDHDRDLHNHPFSYRTFVVHGWYSEEYSNKLGGWKFWRTLGAGDSGHSGPRKFHRITNVPTEGVYTLFLMTRNTTHWGFDVDGEYKDSTRYLLRRGFRREQIPQVQIK